MTETPSPEAPPRRLHRSSSDRMVAGVCGGLADYTGIDPVVFRVVFAVAGLLGGAGVAAYLVAWVVIPADDRGESHAEAMLRDRDIPRIVLIGVGVLGLFALANIVDGPGHRHMFGGGFTLIVLLVIGLWLWNRHEDRPPRPSAPVPPAPPAVAAAAVPPAEPPAPRPPRERSVLAGATVSLALVVAGFLALISTAGADISAGVIFAAALITLGAGMLVGARWGRGRSLIPLAFLLLIATAVTTVADVPLRGGTGARDWHPTTVDALASEYHLAAGQGHLDLRDLDLRGETRHIVATVGAGHLELDLPSGTSVHVDGHTGMGRVSGLGNDDGGVDLTRHADFDGSNGRIVIDAKVGLGYLEVTR